MKGVKGVQGSPGPGQRTTVLTNMFDCGLKASAHSGSSRITIVACRDEFRKLLDS